MWILSFSGRYLLSSYDYIFFPEYCNLEVFSASCGDEEVIDMASASYGLMRKGRCIVTDFGHLGCFSDQLKYMDELCSGRQSCELALSDYQKMKEETPCPQELTPYLEAGYSCQKGMDICVD